jgi:predicted PurR-regulated permease PerM
MPQTPAPSGVSAAELPGLRALLAVVVGVVVVVALALGRDVLIPITLAILLSFVLAPAVELLKRLWLPRVPAVLIAALLALGGMVVLGVLIGTQIAGLAAEIPRYTYTIERKWEAVRDLTFGRLDAVMENVGQGLGRATQEAPAAGPTGADTPTPPSRWRWCQRRPARWNSPSAC